MKRKPRINGIKFVNLTPHIVNLFIDNNIIEFQSEGVCRLEVNEEKIDSLFTKINRGEVYGLPEPKKNTMYIVSQIILSRMNGERKDLCSPNTSAESCVRDGDGKLIGVRGFIKY